MDGASEIEGIVTPDDIIFNRVGMTNINFFELNGAGPVVTKIRENIATWYYSLRILALAILLVVLIYVGIRMATSSIATEQAKYKEMIKNWMVSFALVFLLHYLIIFVIQVNNGLVSIIEGGTESQSYSAGLTGSGGNYEYKSVVLALVEKSLSPLFLISHASLLLYFMIIGITFVFLMSYIKRFLTIGFLIMISPIITITYSIDKMGDGRSQALNTWLKEFLFNVLIQPFHGILYMVFVKSSFDIVASGSSWAGLIFSLMCMKFMWDGEKIIKEIFGFKQASSLGETVASLALATTAANTIKGVATKGVGAATKTGFGKNIESPITKAINKGTKNMKNSLNNTALGKKIDAISKSTKQWSDNNRKGNFAQRTFQSGVDKLGEGGKKAAKMTGNAAKTVAKNMPNVAIGAATWALAAGANDKNALNYGIQSFDTARAIQDSNKLNKSTQEKMEDREETSAKKIDEYAKRNGFENYKNDPKMAGELQNNMEKALDKDMNLLDAKIQMALSKLCNTNGWDPDVDEDKISDEYEKLRTQDLSAPNLTKEEITLGKAIQEKEISQELKTHQSLYKEIGFKDPKATMKEFLEDFKNGQYEDAL